MELRDKLQEVFDRLDVSGVGWGILADEILAIPEIAEALKAYEFANVAMRSGRGVEPMPTDETFERRP